MNYYHVFVHFNCDLNALYGPDIHTLYMACSSVISHPTVQAVREVVPLVYSTDSKSTQHQVQQDSPVSRKLPSNKLDKETAAVGEGERRGERRKTFLARPKPIRPLVSRNRLTTGLGKKKPPQKGPEGPLRPTVGFSASPRYIHVYTCVHIHDVYLVG